MKHLIRFIDIVKRVLIQKTHCTNSRYFANTTKRDKNSFDFTIWAKSDNKLNKDIKSMHHLTDEEISAMLEIKVPERRTIQDNRSSYNDIRDWLRREKVGKEKEDSLIDWDDVVFEVELLKSQEINLDLHS